ncbi:MAG: DUF2784 domain-containing protein [Desulfobulbaceae bacterium]|nr:DUF2784 domain-containing protein [Desulfobulbaceae bacterium]
MFNSFIADLLVILHFSFIIFVVFGGLPTLKWPSLAILHIPSVIWGALLEFYGWMCPLTHLEQHFRRSASDSGYQGGFIQHYLIPIIYPHDLTREVQLGLGLAVVFLNLFIYSAHILKKQSKGRTKQ